ncbi:hypothetical protein KGY71_04630 [Candidatus Bipolaricaulota bacterium]|nr:hypothetical protein [Candidatus Bipolaricaulota bacterium]
MIWTGCSVDCLTADFGVSIPYERGFTRIGSSQDQHPVLSVQLADETIYFSGERIGVCHPKN